MNILFVCSRNKWRSATAETIYKNHSDHSVKSAGTSTGAVVKVSAKSIAWADLIFAMEKKHQHRLRDKFPEEIQGKKIVVLHIKDNYPYMDPELISLIERLVDPYF